MERHIPKAPKRPKRACVSQGTLELIEHRKALAEAGLIEDMRDLGKMIKAAARADKVQWIGEGLKEQCWNR